MLIENEKTRIYAAPAVKGVMIAYCQQAVTIPHVIIRFSYNSSYDFELVEMAISTNSGYDIS